MKVLFVVSSVAGGFQATLGNIVGQLSDTFDCHVIALTSQGDSGFKNRLANHAKSVHFLDKQHKFDTKTYRRFSDICRQIKPDVVKSFDFPSNMCTWWYLALRGIPWVARVPGIETAFIGWRKNLGRMTFLAARYLVVASKSMKDKVIQYRLIAEERVRVIPNAIDVPPYQRTPAVCSSDGKTYLGYVAGFHHEVKGHRFAIEAMRYLPEQYHLLLVGDGPLRASMEQLTRDRKLQDRVTFMGNLDRETVFKTMMSMHALVFPSLGEAFGWALVEAMSIGLPVVASNAPSIPEVVQDGVNGLLFPPGESAKLAEAVLSLFANKEAYALMCDRGRVSIETSFSNERLKRDYINLFLETGHK